MKIPSKYIENAVEQLSSLPGIGKKTALRLALHILNRTKEDVADFSSALLEMKLHVNKCTSCGNVTDTPICEICSDEKRDHSLVCVVEDIRDVLAIESTNTYKGIYHVLNGIISPMDGIGPADLNIETLIEKAFSGDVNEIIFAMSPTMEGDTTGFYLFKKLDASEIKITSLSRGVSVGSELQYADELSLSNSIINRQPFKINI